MSARTRKTCLLLLFIGAEILFFALRGALGVPAAFIERAARYYQRIPEDWQAVDYPVEDMKAMLFYPEDRDGMLLVVYENRPGLSFGYFCTQRFGGPPLIGVGQLRWGGRELVFSLNADRICLAEVERPTTKKTADIDPNKPFVLIIAPGPAQLTLYNEPGAEVYTASIE